MNQASARTYTTQPRSAHISTKLYISRNNNKMLMTRNQNFNNNDVTWSHSKQPKLRHNSHRNSNHINDSLLLRKKPCSNVQPKLTHMKSQLQKLSYRQKLQQVEYLLRRSKELSKQFGYFCATATMLEFHPMQKTKLSIWIHPDGRALKPLHPIYKKTQFQCQLEFVHCLKSTIKQLFPTIQLGSAKTYRKLLGHIVEIRTNLTVINKKTQLVQTHQIKVTKSNKNLANNKLVTSLKSVPNLREQISQRIEQSKEKIRQQKFQNQMYQKDTKSTLLESFKSNNSFQENIKSVAFTLSDKKQNYMTKKDDKIIYEKKDYGIEQVNSEKMFKKIGDFNKIPYEHSTDAIASIIMNESNPNNTQQQKKEESGKKNKMASLIFGQGMSEAEKRKIKHSILKNSKLGKYMTTSIEIQSQLNNLFGSDEFPKGLYDGYLEGTKCKNSILSKVAEQFEDLLF